MEMVKQQNAGCTCHYVIALCFNEFSVDAHISMVDTNFHCTFS